MMSPLIVPKPFCDSTTATSSIHVATLSLHLIRDAREQTRLALVDRLRQIVRLTAARMVEVGAELLHDRVDARLVLVRPVADRDDDIVAVHDWFGDVARVLQRLELDRDALL